MKKMIWIPDDLVKVIEDTAYRNRQSVSGYLVGLHVEKTMSNPVIKEVVKTLIESEPVEEIIKPQKIKNPESLKEKLYTEEYRKKNPMEECRVCHKALRFNCSH